MKPISSEKSPESSASDLAYDLGLKRASQLVAAAVPDAPFSLDDLQASCKGSLVEIAGARSSGRFAIALSALAAATARRASAALIDLGDQLDPRGASEAGVDLERVLWARPARLREALAAAEMAVTAGFHLVVLDLGSSPLSWRGVGAAAFIRLARAAEVHGTVALVVSPYPVCGTAAASAAIIERPQTLWTGEGSSPRLLTGFTSKITLRHRKQAVTYGSIRLSFKS